MPKVKVLFADNTRDSGYWQAEEVRAGLTNGCFYLAGEIEVDAEIEYIDAQDRFSFDPILHEAFTKTQNDVHPNPVIGMKSGNPVYGPAEWNGEFAQRSSQMGDLFVVDGQVFQVGRAFGFERITAYGAYSRTRGITLMDNPWAPGGLYSREINHEFDDLLTD